MAKDNKQFTRFFSASVKKIAQTVSPMLKAKERAEKKIVELQEEIKALDDQIAQWDAPIRTQCGYSVADLVVRETKEVGKDAMGKPIIASKWVLKYPETLVPPTDDENTCDNGVCNVEIPEVQEVPFEKPIAEKIDSQEIKEESKDAFEFCK